MRSTEFLEAFEAHRSNIPAIVSSGVSGALWRHGHVVPTLYNSGMSYATPAAFGVALSLPSQQIIAVEGDGSFLMGLATLATIGRYRPNNLLIVVYNNLTYLPTGTSGELTSAAAHGVRLPEFAVAAGLPAVEADDADEFARQLGKALAHDGPSVVIATVDVDRATWDLEAPTKSLDRTAVAMEFEGSITELAGDERGHSDLALLQAECDDERIPAPQQASEELYAAIKAAGVDLIVYLPEGTLYPVQVMAEKDPEMETVCCTREDEGVAIASGASMAGRTPAVVVEGTGIGMAATALAGLVTRRTPLLIVSSHSSVLGMRRPWDDVAVMANQPILEALHIPVSVLHEAYRSRSILRESVRSARLLKRPVAVVVPPYVIDDDARNGRR